MPTWSADHLRDYERRQSKDRGQASGPKPEQVIRDEPLATAQGTGTNTGRAHIRIVSYRNRLIDPDNLCVKYFIDGLRYNKFIPDDTAKHITLQVSQEHVSKAEQRTEIEIEYL